MFFSSPSRRDRAVIRQRTVFWRRVFVCSSLLSGISTLAAGQQRRQMTIDDVIDLTQLSAPRILPDGRRAIYTVSELGKWKDNKRVTSILIVDADGSKARRFLAHENDRAPAWSWDGRAVAFRSTCDASADGEDGDNADAQIWTIPVDVASGAERS